MIDHNDFLAKLPAELGAFFAEASLLRAEHLRIYPLTAEESRVYTGAICDADVGAALGLIVLDDAGDSNPYCYISNGPARGMVLHFSHDPEPLLSFSSLASFKLALKQAIESELSIDDLKPEQILPVHDQIGLVSQLQAYAIEGDDISEFYVCTFLPLLDPGNLQVLVQLGEHASFFIREAVAVFIRDHCRPEYKALAESLAGDQLGQVSRPALQALKAIRCLCRPQNI